VPWISLVLICLAVLVLIEAVKIFFRPARPPAPRLPDTAAVPA